jgi:hydroxymethylglutaryl-CoA synthase
MLKVGIEKISFYTPENYLHLDVLAQQKSVDPAKFSAGIGQEKIAMPAHDEDIVTMAAEAALPLLKTAEDMDGIDTLLFATETSIDQSKSAGLYVHQLLGLPQNCRNVEMKQACYAGTAALQMACAHVTRKPNSKVLVIASDVSRYDLESPGEATQGAGAVAIIVSANPKILEISNASGCYSEDIMDFWRPNYRKTPVVDGKYSALKYMQALGHAFKDYQEQDEAINTADMSRFCYHIPFTRMAKKAHKHLCDQTNANATDKDIEDGLIYNRIIGNCYNASLYISLASTLENADEDLSQKNIALFSYGSGAVAEFFTGKVVSGYQTHLQKQRHEALLNERKALSYNEYLKLWNAPDPQDGEEHEIPQSATSEIRSENTKRRFRLTKITDHKRIYAADESASKSQAA